jgi:uncharacterized protein (DUF433 family)
MLPSRSKSVRVARVSLRISSFRRKTAMIAEKAQKLLGVGLYTPAEAALYARIRTQLMNRWVFGDKAGDPVLRAEEEVSEEKIVSFIDFVQAMAVRSIRLEHKVPLRKIRQALTKAEKDYGLPYLFARQHMTFLFNGEIFVKRGEDEMIEMSGKGAGRRAFKKIIELYMKDLIFDDKGLASAYSAFEWRGNKIVMNPHVRFGEPMVGSSGYSARALWDAYQAEGDAEAVVKAYGVKTEEVEAACRYFDVLRSAA